VAVLVAGVIVTGLMHDTAVAVLLVLIGGALLLNGFIGDRLKSVGPKGVELFEATKEQIADALEKAQPTEVQVTTADDAKVDDRVTVDVRPRAGGATAQAAAQIRAARTPDELANVMMKLINRPETSAERTQRVQQDERTRETLQKWNPRR
jgi:hypothetical protein